MLHYKNAKYPLDKWFLTRGPGPTRGQTFSGPQVLKYINYLHFVT